MTTYWAILFHSDDYIPELFETRAAARNRIKEGSMWVPSMWRGAYVAKVQVREVRRRAPNRASPK